MRDQLQRWARGVVRGHLVGPGGRILNRFCVNNTILYGGADIMARLLGGDQAYVPRYMGFVYGAAATPTLAPIARATTWADIAAELADPAVTGNMLISPLSTSPSYSVDGSASYYTGNSTGLIAHSGATYEYGFPTGGGSYAGPLIDGYYFYQALILTRLVQGTTVQYLPFARVSLLDGTYPEKLSGFELALFWNISYF